jgi:hypothetical protein
MSMGSDLQNLDLASLIPNDLTPMTNDIFDLIFFKIAIILLEKFEGKFETWRNGNETENISYDSSIHFCQSKLCGQRTVHPC